MLNSIVSSIFNGFIYMLGFEAINITALSATKYNGAWLITEIIFTAILPAFFEELIHRGMLFHATKKQIGSKKALLISSLLFGLMHMNVQQFFYAAILGYLIGLVAYHTNSIYPCMILHFCNNFLSVGVSFIEAHTGTSINLTNLLGSLGITSPIAVITCTSLLFMLLIWAIIRCYQLLKLSMEKTKINRYVEALEKQGVSQIDTDDLMLHLQQAQEEKQREFHTNNSYAKLPERYRIGYRVSVLLGALVTLFTFIWGIL